MKEKFERLFEGEKKFTVEEAEQLATELGYKGDIEEFRKGLDIELEHGTKNPETNITDDDPLMTAKITIAHLKEIPDYNTRLLALEKEAKSGVNLDEKLVALQCPCGYSTRGDDKYEDTYGVFRCPKCGSEMENLEKDINEAWEGTSDEILLGKYKQLKKILASTPNHVIAKQMIVNVTAELKKRGALKEATHGEVAFDTFDKKLDEALSVVDIDDELIERLAFASIQRRGKGYASDIMPIDIVEEVVSDFSRSIKDRLTQELEKHFVVGTEPVEEPDAPVAEPESTETDKPDFEVADSFIDELNEIWK